MTIEEFEKLSVVLEDRFSLNEAHAITRVISNENSSKETMIELLSLINKNSAEEIDNYDELIDRF
nr:MAG TPA: hypothetical protein [Caudoviricetes sp.]